MDGPMEEGGPTWEGGLYWPHKWMQAEGLEFWPENPEYSEGVDSGWVNESSWIMRNPCSTWDRRNPEDGQAQLWRWRGDKVGDGRAWG